MLFKFTLIAILLTLALTAPILAQDPVQISGYVIDFRLDVPSGRILVAADLQIEKTTAVDSFVLLLTERAVIESISAESKGKSQIVGQTYIGLDSLQLTLPTELKSATELTLKFEYNIEIPEWGGSLMMLGRNHHWYPMLLDQIATVQLKTAAYTTFEIYSAGDLISKSVEGDWEFREYQTRIPVFKIPLVISRTGHLQAMSDTTGKIDLFLHTTAARAGIRQALLKQTAEFLAYYENLLGPYHHQGLTMIEVGGFSGVEIGTGLLLIGSGALDQYERGNISMLSLVVANQWLGAGVFPRYGSQGFWFLTLSLPHYLRIMNLEDEVGGLALAQELKTLQGVFQPLAGTASEITILEVDKPDSDVKAKLIYAKGPLVVDKLRAKLGDKVWRTFLRQLYQQYQGKILSLDSFTKLLGKHDTSGEAVKLMQRLLTSKGMP
jgi:hypothetical protein